MRSAILSVFLCLSLAVPVGALQELPGCLPKTVSPDKSVTRLEAIQTINSAMTWWEDYTIEIETGFWARLWLQVKRFFGYLTVDVQRLINISKSKHSSEMFISQRWGMSFDEKTINEKISGWQLLELESKALSKALRYRGLNRSLTDEVETIRTELKTMNDKLQASYKDVIAAHLISKPEYTFTPDESWVYYIFATQHDLLPAHEIKIPKEILGSPLNGSQLDAFTKKLVNLLKQMAQDLKSGS